MMRRRQHAARAAASSSNAKLAGDKLALSERQFQQGVLELLKLHGWSTYAIADSRTQYWGTDAGFPDLICLREGDPRLLVLELKTATGKLTPEQERWLRMFHNVREVWAGVVRPSDDWTPLENLVRGGERAA